MKVPTVLIAAILFLLPAAIVPAYVQEHEGEKQPEQKQQQAKPAQHQQQAKQPRQQHAASQQPAKPAQQPQRGQEQQRASRGAQPAAGHGSIPEAKFRSSFGSGHRFHVNRSEFANGSGRFQYGGYWFNAAEPWPVGWPYTDDVYVDYLNGGYFLCDPVHPGVYISINIG
jgi:hemolysin activation/secretion protein